MEKDIKTLPDFCYSVLQSTGEIVILKQGESGYFRTDIAVRNKEEALEFVEEYNSKLGVSKSQAQAMSVGSMFGWDVPGADPSNYDENGMFIVKEKTHIKSLNEQIDYAEFKKESLSASNIDVPDRDEVL